VDGRAEATKQSAKLSLEELSIEADRSTACRFSIDIFLKFVIETVPES
jgi:hypothetical protein